MEQIIIEHLYKPKIEEIWNGTSPSVPLQKFGYDVVDHLHKGKIMFVGFNPSAPQDPPPARLFTKISGANNSLYPYLRPFRIINSLRQHFPHTYMSETQQRIALMNQDELY